MLDGAGIGNPLRNLGMANRHAAEEPQRIHCLVSAGHEIALETRCTWKARASSRPRAMAETG